MLIRSLLVAIRDHFRYQSHGSTPARGVKTSGHKSQTTPINSVEENVTIAFVVQFYHSELYFEHQTLFLNLRQKKCKFIESGTKYDASFVDKLNQQMRRPKVT